MNQIFSPFRLVRHSSPLGNLHVVGVNTPLSYYFDDIFEHYYESYLTLLYTL